VVKLHFNSTHDFEKVFKSKTLAVTRGIIYGIEQAIVKNKRSANIFEISFEEAELTYEVSLPKSQWEPALKNCLDHLHENSLADEQIDCWKLMELVKTL